MLVLSRKKGESIVIGNDIEIVIVGVEGDNIKLGIHAPKDIEIYRKEVYEAIQEANREASGNGIAAEEVKKLFSKKE